jgi:hypothetical protein
VETAAIKMMVFGGACVVVALIWLFVKPERLPAWLQLQKFEKHRVVFAVLTLLLGALLVGTALMGPPKQYKPPHVRPQSDAR